MFIELEYFVFQHGLLLFYVCLCLTCFATTRLYYHVFQTLSTTFFNFFRFIFALSKKAFKTHRCFCCFVVVVCDSFVRLSHDFLFVNNFFKNIFHFFYCNSQTTISWYGVVFANPIFATLPSNGANWDCIISNAFLICETSRCFASVV